MQTKNFKVFLESYVNFLEEVAAGEGEKHAALLSYDSKRIDRATSNQQAMNMRLAQMEQQREAEQDQIGWGGLTFHEILERVDKSEQADFVALFERFARAVSDIKYFNGKSIVFAQEGLKVLGVTEEKARSASYGADGKRAEDVSGPALFETKV